MNSLFYRSLGRAPMWAVICLWITSAACAPRLAKIDDQKLAGVPEERLAGVYEAKKDLAGAKAEMAKAQDAATEADLFLKVRRAALEVAEAKADQSDAEFALARFQNQNDALVQAGEAQRADELGVRRAAADVEVARALLALAQRKNTELEKKIGWLEARLEHERAKVALRYDDGSPNQKSAQLSEYERAALEAQLTWKGADSKLKQAAVDLDTAKAVRAALDGVK